MAVKNHGRAGTWSDETVLYVSPSASQSPLPSTSESQWALDSWRRLIDDLLAIRNLRDDWDSDGATAPRGDVVDSAIDFLHSLQRTGQPYPNRVAATPNGGVLLEWQAGPDHYAEAEIEVPYLAQWMMITPASPRAVHFEQTWLPRRQNEAAAAFYAGGGAIAST